jgi:hypothetical protein
MSQRDVLCGAWGKPNKAVEPTASSFGSAALRLRFRRRLTAGVRLLLHAKRA